MQDITVNKFISNNVNNESLIVKKDNYLANLTGALPAKYFKSKCNHGAERNS